MTVSERKGFGWIPDFPDFRDYSENTNEVREILGQAGMPGTGRPSSTRKNRAASPAAVDLREWASAVEDQGSLGSCTAQAGAGVIEYYERKSFGRHIDASRLFL